MKQLVPFLLAILPWVLSSCAPDLTTSPSLIPAAVPTSNEATVTVTSTVVNRKPATRQPAAVTLSQATPDVKATASPTASATPSPTPTRRTTETAAETAAATSTARPTPENLPPAPDGWEWRLLATKIPVTHYIITEPSPSIADEEMESAYGLDDQPLAGVEPLPRTFLQETAYQGSGRLPNGDILQYAAVRPPVERGLVPFRYVITPQERCDGHPLAGNGTCSVPLQTGATTWREGEGPLVPVGSTIFIPELGMKIRINDVAVSDGPAKIDLYTGTVNNYDYERPDGASIWILVEDIEPAGQELVE